MRFFRRDKNPKTSERSEPEDKMEVLSILSPDDIKGLGGLPKEAIAGLISHNPLAKGKISPEQFRANVEFVRFMHHVIKTFGPNDPTLQAAAAQQQNGYLYIIDLRTPEGPQGNVPFEDIIGSFEVKDGQLIQDAYWANEKHIVFSTSGLVRLPPFLQDAFIRELKRMKSS